MESRPVLGTSKNKPKMSWMSYIFEHLIPTWFQQFGDNFEMWSDLITGKYEKYKLLDDDDSFEECYSWFWSSINTDETLPKEFIEYLQQLSVDAENGNIKLYTLNEFEINKIIDLVNNNDDI